jgi:hypothetical protein
MKAQIALTLVAALAGGSLTSAAPRPRVVRAGVVVRTPALSIHVGGPIRVRHGHGRLDVEVSPERAKVYVDGRYYGRGDKRLTLPAGFHRVKTVLGDGREVEAETVHVTAGRLTRVRLDL